MKCIIDVVYNPHIADSVAVREHPSGSPQAGAARSATASASGSDIIDLDYNQPALWDYQIETLVQWARIVDGFRCDVAPLIPLPFWLRAREGVEKVRPGCLWLSESVEPCFTADNRARGMVSLSDSEIYQAFDLSYEYDVYGDFIRCLQGGCSLAEYAEAINGRIPVSRELCEARSSNTTTPSRPFTAGLAPARNWTLLYFQKA
jgi:hypothetical protein